MELTSDDGELTPELRLGRQVRQLREQRGLSLRGLSKEVSGYAYSYIHRVEQGKQKPSTALVRALDEFFGTCGALAEIYGLSEEMRVAQYSLATVKREQEAIRIQVFASSHIPGLLQTESYAREHIRAGLPAAPHDEVEALVASRMDRQYIFARADPPFYWAIMDEAAFRRPTGDKAVMCEQLEHILRFAENPHVTVQVLPFVEGLHPMLGGSLTLHTLGNGTTAGLVESFGTGDPVDSPRRIVVLTQRFDLVRSKALSESKSLDLIRDYLKEYEGENYP
ncbi:helix-turn-helix domain-containing protein [Streptomyces sp. JH002]|uniref:helix-turn-helix domain-containing protein n=2 Tax=unclassified Streptomyces TaxID=2593676 RepID=UPI003D804FFA